DAELGTVVNHVAEGPLLNGIAARLVDDRLAGPFHAPVLGHLRIGGRSKSSTSFGETGVELCEDFLRGLPFPAVHVILRILLGHTERILFKGGEAPLGKI